MAALLCIAACASSLQPLSPSGVKEQCTDWFARLDAATDAHHVRDGAAARVPGFAWLRVSRFAASWRGEAAASKAALSAWLAQLQALDADGRSAEWANLPQAARLPGHSSASAAARTAQCAHELSVALTRTQRQALLESAQVPDEYRDWKRALGLYALTQRPFFAGVQRWQEGLKKQFDSPAADASAVRYVPVAGDQLLAAQTAAQLAQSPVDALGIPQLPVALQERLLGLHAPVVTVGTTGNYDRFGALRWGQLAAIDVAPEVAIEEPVAYRRLEWTRWGADVLPQLVYSFWFPERPAQGALDLLAGPLDAVVLRITLDKNGTPLMVDSIHACGCYHLFFPVDAVRPKPAPDSAQEWAFVPKQLPTLKPGLRIAIQLESRTHYVVGIAPDTGAPGEPYRMLPDDALRTLSTAQGTTRSAFWPSGIVPGTARGERALFWPMGIDSPGAMRQWGRQLTAFVGRRHFDDAWLLHERFERGGAATPP